ncbi:MAG: hypothetical protein QOG21_1519, partial [Actinomycetota bacterium]|nr:hypothetical protein [Actinomycetota bacterium]
VSYGQIPRAARATKHQAMAEWIEDVGERLDDHAEVLAYHYSTALELAKSSGASDVAKLEGKSQRFLIAAAERAVKLDASRALALYRQALELIGPNDPETPRVLQEAGKACRSLGLFPESTSYLEQAVEGFSARGDPLGEGKASGILAVLLRDQGSFEEGRRSALRSVHLLEQQPPGNELSLAYQSMAGLERGAGSLDEALAWADKALEVARSSADAKTLWEALGLRGLQRCEIGDVGGLADLREATDLSEELGDPLSTFTSYNNLADQLWLIEGPAEGLKINSEAQVIGRAHGFVYQMYWARMGALFMLFEVGSWDQLVREANELIAWAQEQSAALVESVSTFVKAVALFHLGETHEALSLEESFLPLARDMDEREFLLPCLSFCSLLHAATGDNVTTLTLIREFEMKTEQARHYRARYLPDIVRAALSTGNAQHVSQLLVEDDVFYAQTRNAVITTQALLAEAQGDLEHALSLHGDAAQRWKEYGFVLEEGQALLGEGRCLVALGRKLEAPQPLQRAREIFLQLGALPLVQETDIHLERATALTS